MTKRVPLNSRRSLKEAIQVALSKHLIERQRALTESMMVPENVLRYSHGSSWKHPALPTSVDGGMERHSAEFPLSFQRLVDGDLSVVQEAIDQVALQMQEQFLKSMYGVMTETCDRTGNTVDAREVGGFPEAFEQMIRKIEFSVDRDGKVGLPQLHVADAAPIKAALEAQSEEYHVRIKALIEEKSQKALADEEERKSKFEGKP